MMPHFIRKKKRGRCAKCNGLGEEGLNQKMSNHGGRTTKEGGSQAYTRVEPQTLNRLDQRGMEKSLQLVKREEA